MSTFCRPRTAREGVVEFSAAAARSLCGKPWGVVTGFECPLCGGGAKAISAAGNGRKAAKCTACHFRVIERGK
ncbi:MAG: hypothetical protein NC299_11810 [Lachnospiraceae bacterium]|nr:hypothetical protein [Lachnospiraceae bacterium]